MFLTLRDTSQWEDMEEPDPPLSLTYQFFFYTNIEDEAALRQRMIQDADITLAYTDSRFKPYHLDYSRIDPVIAINNKPCIISVLEDDMLHPYYKRLYRYATSDNHGYTLEIHYPYTTASSDNLVVLLAKTLKICLELQRMVHEPFLQEYISIAVECELYLIKQWFKITKHKIPKKRAHEHILSNIITMYFERYLFSGICSKQHMRIVIYTAYYFMVRMGYWFLDYTIEKTKPNYYRVFRSNMLLYVPDEMQYIIDEIGLYIEINDKYRDTA